MKLLLFTFLAFCSLVFRSATAGPDETTQNLISDPASMMDIGILRTEIELKSQNLGHMAFDWDENRLNVHKLIFEGEYPDQASAELECATWIGKVRGIAGIKKDTGKPYGNHSLFAENFSHAGFQRGSTPENLLVDLDKLFVLNCWVYTPPVSVEVTAPLLGTSYSVVKTAGSND